MRRILYFVILAVFSLQSCIKQDTFNVQAQFKSDTEAIREFVSQNNPGAKEMSTGFWYSIDNLGNGVYPALADTVTVSYTVKLIPNPLEPPDLKEADLDSVGYSTSTTIVLSKTISGLQQGLILFPANSSGRIYIPSGLAFGTSAHYDKALDTSNVFIPSNANLLYEIKLISVKGQRLKTDIATIDSYLLGNGIEAQHDESSGIRYTVDQQGTGTTYPLATDSLLVTYTEKVLIADTLIASVNTPTKVALKNQVTCWRIMLPKYFTKGSTITIYSPSGYAYGSSGSTIKSIPANSNMVYQITLDSIHH